MLLEELKYANTQMNILYDLYAHYNEKEKALIKEWEDIHGKKAQTGILFCELLFVVGPTLLVLSFIIFAVFEPNESIVISVLLIVAVCYIAILIILPIKQSKTFNQKKELKCKEIDRKLSQLKYGADPSRIDLQNYLESGEFSRLSEIIPEDYFYPAAVEKFLYYVKNGHAETMKEALLLYDEYLHRCRMEYEAARAANASERTAAAASRTAAAVERAADVAERSANAAEDTAYYAKVIAQDTNNMNFWVTYNSLKHLG